MPRTTVSSFRTSSVSSVGALHKAIRDGDFDCMRERVEEDASLLVRPNTIGWTALHFCAASHEIDFDTWKWVLRSIPNDTDLVRLRTDTGQNAVDHFFRRYLNPLEWQTHQVKEAAKELATSIQHFLDDDEQLDLLRRVLDSSSEEHVRLTGEEISPSNNNHIVLVVPFWRRMKVLLQRISSSSDETAFSIVHSLATTGCPKAVAQLAIRLYPAHLSKRDAHGSLPLHLACQHEGAATMMECLLPSHANSYDGNDRLPLHIALSFGKTWHDGGVSHLWKAHPLEGGIRDKETALPAFLLANFPCQTVVERATRTTASEIYKGLFRFIPRSTQQKILADARDQVDLQYLSTIYELLRQAPNAISCCFEEVPQTGM
eukprot:CAMPEP_0119018242 /NCGR_PEP_ID=MMETSP1176-20130426/18891_1 /TAXON_ID=265551 /ORGANISM="Synedropsis recta cf, Strain CCMP1620" /LENGTH=373 /DNA_ID=CAMNT_0006972197 /DNA_START=87 /DNA_END=1208 /DNA_ORIENTATION=+